MRPPLSLSLSDRPLFLSLSLSPAPSRSLSPELRASILFCTVEDNLPFSRSPLRLSNRICTLTPCSLTRLSSSDSTKRLRRSSSVVTRPRVVATSLLTLVVRISSGRLPRRSRTLFTSRERRAISSTDGDLFLSWVILPRRGRRLEIRWKLGERERDRLTCRDP